jgi:hypothetical protein
MLPPLSLTIVQGLSTQDTLVMRTLPPVPTWWAQVTEVAGGILILLTVALVAGLLLLMLRLRKTVDKLEARFDELSTDAKQLIERGKAVTESVADITAGIREEMVSIRETVEVTNRRARRAVSRLADRVDQFNGALEAVQRDTQGVIVSAIAAVRGLRAGVAAMRRKPRRPAPAEITDDFDDDDGSLELARELPSGPRLRRRVRHQG